MTADRFLLHRLAFTGPGKELRDLDFSSGLTVIWGGSQAGKSYTAKAIDHMFGSGSALPSMDASGGYDRCWLEIDLPKSGRVTLARSMSKGGYQLFNGTIDNSLHGEDATVLSDSHSSKKGNISSFLLNELGFGDHKIAKDLNGSKAAFTIRHLANYMITEETPMISEKSPTTISDQSGETFNKNVLKFLLTGVDDSSIVEVPDNRELKQANSGKIEIVEEMLKAAMAELSSMYPGVDSLKSLELQDQSTKLEATLERFRLDLSGEQTNVDSLIRERRHLVSERDDCLDLMEDCTSTIGRFELLKTSYASDMKRLVALEIGAEALMAGAKLTCILCGAEPEHQHVEHGFEAVETSRTAVEAELRKVKAESAGLLKAIDARVAEQTRLQRQVTRIDDLVLAKDNEISIAKRAEANTRHNYERLDTMRKSLHEALSVERRIASLNDRLKELSAYRPAPRPRGSVAVGAGTVVGDELAAAVQEIFHAWRYPGSPRISFNEKTHDILMNGKQRNANGKGVRALLNAAFKIGVMDVCRRRGVPHPGVIVLDSPLLSYRDPITSRHGALSADEEELETANLKFHFYNDLIRRSTEAQFIILENQDPPFTLPEGVREHRFAGEHGTEGRRGLF